jgi:response regulator RpfG family c-di-GMP phosphodiesterase/signal transduction histidine kinase
MNKNKELLKRYYAEYDLRKRVRLSIILSIIFYPSFLILDVIYTPEHFSTFVIIRMVVIVLNLVLLISHRPTKSVRGQLNLGMALLIIDAFGIAIMIQIMGGFLSSYYQGLTIVIMCMMVLLPFALREAVIVSGVIWLGYVIPSILLINKESLEWKYPINNLFFISAIIIIGAFAAHVMDKIRRRALVNLVELEDMTDKLRESNTKLKSLDELKNQFFANVNHELRTPLTLILAPLSPMIDEKMGRITAKQKDTLVTMRHNSLKLLKLINNLLDLTKMEEGKMRLKIRKVEFVEYINAQLTSVKPLADQKGITLYFQHPPHPVEIIIDPDHFEKVILNLLSNALKFTSRDDRITVYIEENKSTIKLIVEDTGIGIPSDMLKNVFDRFSQVDGSLSRPHEGTGIGLALAYEIVNIHGGKIFVESELGKGSKFHVEMKKGEKHFSREVLDRRTKDQPVSFKKRSTDKEYFKVHDIVTDARKLQLMDIETVDISQEIKDTKSKHDYRLLVIDDNPEVLKLMKLILSDEFDLDLINSAEEGLKILKEKMSDLVLCDVMMPGLDGQAFCRMVKEDEATQHTPVILVTARSSADMLAEGIESGADDYISKPFDPTELMARIRSLLRMRRAETELALANRNLRMRTSDLVDRQRSLFLSMIKSLVSALEAKDQYTRAHSSRVTEITLKIAEKMGLGDREKKDLELAAVLHDVGKIAIPEKILNKKTSLTDKEFQIIKTHPLIGETILKPVIELNEIGRTIRHHHERYDGAGYPDKLKSLGIPIGARIMAVADTYDAITSERPYRTVETHNFAVKEIVRCSGTQFDPEVVENFIEIASQLKMMVHTTHSDIYSVSLGEGSSEEDE